MPPITKEVKENLYHLLIGEGFDPDDGTTTFDTELYTRYVLECRMGMGVTYCGDCPNFLGCGLVKRWKELTK